MQPVQIAQLHEIAGGFGQTHLALAELAIVEPIRQLDEALRISTHEELETDLETAGLNLNAHGQRAIDQKKS